MTDRDVDGYTHLNTADDGLVLTVYPPQGSGKRVTLEAVKAEIEQTGISGWQPDDLKHAVDNATGHPVVLVQPKANTTDAQIFVEVSEDEMSAKVTVLGAESGKPATVDRVRAVLAAQGVVFGLKEDQLNALAPALAAQGPKSAPVEFLAAEGTPVVDGADAFV